MNIDTSVLRNFLVLSDTLHFTRSSDKSFIAQPALSRQIKQLEDKIGAQLFTRNKRNVELTPAGKYFKQEAERLLSQFDYTVKKTAKLHKGEAGEVRIGYTHSVMQSFLPALIRHINELLPTIRIVLLEFNNVRQYTALKNRDIDIGFSTNPELDESFKSKLVLKENFAIAMPLDHAVGAENFTGLNDFKNDHFILAPKSEGPMYVATIESIFVDAGFLPSIIHETPFASTSIRLVEKGVGVTIEPLSSLKGYGGITYIELTEIPQKAEIHMLWLPSIETEFAQLIHLLQNFQVN